MIPYFYAESKKTTAKRGLFPGTHPMSITPRPWYCSIARPHVKRESRQKYTKETAPRSSPHRRRRGTHQGHDPDPLTATTWGSLRLLHLLPSFPETLFTYRFPRGNTRMGKSSARSSPQTKKTPTIQSAESRCFQHWSRLPDSNRGPHPYHGCALPAELSRRIFMVVGEGFEPS